MQISIQVSANIIALLAIAYYLPGLEFEGKWWLVIIGGAVAGILNLVLRPFLTLILNEYVFMLLAVFTALINLAFFIAMILLVPGFFLTGMWPAFWGITILTLTNYSIHSIMGYNR